ncbi:MAG: hypothetical protein QOI11_1003 [Candidatus Eremiobacteraeota bacterium]|jgi:hypothetical protein|nr:hypothetical protein [Candidatus Eremiobacteraeota bacterium]
MRRDASRSRDRVLAAIEVPALGIWLGALTGFAFVSAPLAFHLIAPLDVGRFAALVAGQLAVLTKWGYALGGIALIVALLRAVRAGDRTWDIARAAIVAVALALSTYHQRVIVQAMQVTPDLTSPAYHALHARSTQVYGAVVLLGLIALVLAAARRDDA